jgi:hypothetical protein
LTHVVAPAENFIGNLIALSNITDNDLFAFSDHDAIDGSSVMRCARSAPT